MHTHTHTHTRAHSFMLKSCTLNAVIFCCSVTQGLAADLGEGTQRLNDATKTGENTLSSTSPSGQTKIRKELSVMKRDFEEYHVMLKEAQDDLERCLSRWNEFEDSYNQFNSWLKETETYLRSDLDLKSNLDEKKKHWEQYQVSFTHS